MDSLHINLSAMCYIFHPLKLNIYCNSITKIDLLGNSSVYTHCGIYIYLFFTLTLVQCNKGNILIDIEKKVIVFYLKEFSSNNTK